MSADISTLDYEWRFSLNYGLFFFFACFASYSFYVYKTVIIPYKMIFLCCIIIFKKIIKYSIMFFKNAVQNIVEGHT